MIEPGTAQILLIAALALAGVATIAWLCALPGRERMAKQLQRQEQRLVNLEKQLKTTTQGAIGMGQRILALEEKLQYLQREAQAVDNQDSTYTQAMQLFEQGIDADTVAASCGLSHAEASLMAMLHKHKAA